MDRILVRTVVRTVSLCATVALSSCNSGSSGGSKTPASAEPSTIPDFEAATFTNPTVVDNAYFPLTPGSAATHVGATEDGLETIVEEVLHGSREVLGVDCVIVRVRAFLGELLIEDTQDWYAQDDDGNVWYMGEEVDNYRYDEDDELVEITHEGGWEAGLDVAGVGATARPGHIMRASPRPGDRYNQEFYEGEAEDMGEVIALGVVVTLEDGAVHSCLQIRDFTPLEPGRDEYKYYARGIGPVREEKVDPDDGESVELKAVFVSDGSDLPDFSAASFSDPTRIDHPYFPLTPGRTQSFEGETAAGVETIIEEVLEENREVLGVDCVVVRVQEFVDGVLTEDSRDWYAQDDAGNVWSMGEKVDRYEYDEDGALIEITHEGGWEAGLDVAGLGTIARPGQVMPASPTPRDPYRQVFYESEAEDMGLVVQLGLAVELEDGTRFEDCVQTLDWTPLEPHALEYKYYARGVGLILEQVPGQAERIERVEIDE